MSTLRVIDVQHPSASSANLTLDSSGNVTAAGTVAMASPFYMRNKIINGGFDIWQRFTATATWVAPISNYYVADRWLFNSSGTGGNGSVSRQTFTPGQTDVPGEPTYFLRWEITSAASGQSAGGAYMEQRIEGVQTLAGANATLTFYAKGTGTLPNIYAVQNFGSGGSAQVTTTIATNVALSATWTKYTYTFAFPSISGKTIGANNYAGITIMVPINSTYTLDLAEAQLEEGTIPTPFEQIPIQQQLALCQRYYYRIFPQTGATLQSICSSGQAFSTTQGGAFAQFPVTMRIRPTAVEQSGTASDYGWLTASGGTQTASGVPTYNGLTSTTGGYVTTTTASGLVAGNSTLLLARANGAFLGWSAEL